MAEQKFPITVDMRESRSGLTQQLEKSTVVTVQFAELAVGDFVLSQDVVVERKAAVDFVSSIMDRRLFGQVSQMKATYLRPIIMIEGISLVHTKTPSESASFIEVMTRHAQEGLGYEISLRGSKPRDLKVLAQYAVEGLPGCGPGTAKKLLGHFGSAERVFAATIDQLCEVKGVGRKTAEQIRELLSYTIATS